MRVALCHEVKEPRQLWADAGQIWAVPPPRRTHDSRTSSAVEKAKSSSASRAPTGRGGGDGALVPRGLGPSVLQLARDEAAAHARARTAGVDADGDGEVVLRAEEHAVPLKRLEGWMRGEKEGENSAHRHT